jgi:hypothetical protein
MSPGLRTFFRVGSWIVMIVTALAAVLMVLAIFAMPGGWATRFASIIPASSMMLTLGFSAGAGLRTLVSIEERLSSAEREF